MYEVKRKTHPSYFSDYIYQTKNKFGQNLTLEICLLDSYLGGCYNVTFYIASKRKHGYKSLEQTGRDGIKALLWAKACIQDFIFNPPKRLNANKIIIEGDDSRRFRIYENKLRNLGFRKFSNYNSLIKRI